MSHSNERQGGARMGFGPRGLMSPVEKPKNFKGTLRRLSGYLRPQMPKLITIFVMAILSTLFMILGPKIMGLATTRLFQGLRAKLLGVPGAQVDFDYILRILMILGGLYILSAVFGFLQQYLMAGVSQTTVYNMRKEVKLKLARLPLKYYDSHAHGDILSRVTNDIDTISSTLQQSLTQLISSGVTLVGILIMMLTISPTMTLMSFIIIPAAILVTKAIAPRSQKHFAGQQKSLGELNGHVEEIFTGHKVVKAFGQEAQALEEFDTINERLFQSGWKAQFISGLMMPLLTFINNIGYVLVCVVGGIFVTRGIIPIGDVQAFISYSRQFSQPIAQTANIANILQSTIAAAERVFELLDEEEEAPETDLLRDHQPIQGAIRFQDVSFSYKEDSPLIQGLNVAVAPGQSIAIVGPTGAGKTTLVNLLMRFYDVSQGHITVDGVDIRDMKRGELRSIFGMVLQDTWLFNGTIRENIAYGRPGASEEDIIRAAQAAHADHFIRTLPQGYDTVLNEEASNISQGQKQLLTIARAFLADPAVLILDEATSNVDTRTEIIIQRAMAKLMEKRTAFVIAHRLSTIKNADSILVMNEGKIIETGTHQELMDRQGFYAELYNSQFAKSLPSEAKAG